MKEKIGWIVGIVEVIVGFAFFVTAQAEMSSNSRYTWRRPYTDYEQQVILTKWIGLALLIAGIIGLGIRIYKYIYTNKHTEDINEISRLGGTIKCPGCGLIIVRNVAVCPRCGKEITVNLTEPVNKNSDQANPGRSEQEYK